MSMPLPQERETNPRLIAFYLTQFHPIPENDEWWGKGFTEWTNVTKAKPLFDGHEQPQLPSDLGFYDLRVRMTRHQQIKLAREYGIDGFCYHYYWFSGTRLLNQPLDDMLADPQSDMPFCLCWANENWTRRWDAAEHQVLIAQKYLPNDDLDFIKSLQPYFADPRYIRVEGKPFLIVYRPQHLPDARRTAAIWREYCRSVGIGEIHVCSALTHGNEDYQQFGFDSGVEFPPHNMKSPNIAKELSFYEPFRGIVAEYPAIARSYLNRVYAADNIYKGVFPAWDNSPRTGSRAVIVLNSSPDNFEYWLGETIELAKRHSSGEARMVFINAWNEWAEGCRLEPDRTNQRRYLEATLRAKRGVSKVTGFTTSPLPSMSGLSHRSLWGDLRGIVSYHSYLWLAVLATWIKRYPRLRRFLKRLFRI